MNDATVDLSPPAEVAAPRVGNPGDTRAALRPGPVFLVAATALLVAATIGPNLWCAVSPRMDLTWEVTIDRHGGRWGNDPWSQRMLSRVLSRWDPDAWREYSAGPNGVDEVGAGDDITVLPQYSLPFMLCWYLRPLASWLLVTLILTRLLVALPLGRSTAHEMLRSGLIAFVPVASAWLLHSLLAEKNSQDYWALQRALSSLEIGAWVPTSSDRHLQGLGRLAQVHGSLALLAWLVVFGARWSRRSRS